MATVASIVCVHAWRNTPDGDCEYCDPAEQAPHGWCVYTRTETPSDPQQPFDLSNECDFSTQAEAMAEAQSRAAGGEIRVY